MYLSPVVSDYYLLLEIFSDNCSGTLLTTLTSPDYSVDVTCHELSHFAVIYLPNYTNFKQRCFKITKYTRVTTAQPGIP